jgi:sarcosine oxidase
LHFDHIVIGIGGMGSAALRALALRGQRVLGIEQFKIAHDQGSSHGHSRIIRLAYNEHPDYVPLLRRAFGLWAEIQDEYGERLFFQTGGLDVGPAAGRVVQGALAACKTHALDHEWLEAGDVCRRFVGIRVPSHYAAVFHQEAGYLDPEACITAMAQSAVRHGAILKEGEKILSLSMHDQGCEVVTDRDRYTSDGLVVTAGAWSSRLLPRLKALAIPERQVVGWFDPAEPNAFVVDRFPVFILDSHLGEYYGFPIDSRGRGFKIGRYHHLEEQVDLSAPMLEPGEGDEAVLRQAISTYFPGANGPLQRMQTCMFTNSPDGHFIIDRDPADQRLAFGAGFSGHGFKFACVVGELLSELACEPEQKPLPLFSVARFD